MVFIDSQNFGNFRQKLSGFWTKKRHFFAGAAKILKTKFRRKSLLVCGKWLNWSKTWYKCTLRVSATIVKSRFCYILLFANFTAAEMRRKGDFCQNIAIFSQKSPLSAHFGKHKIGKKQNIKKTALYDCSRNPKVHLFPFLD